MTGYKEEEALLIAQSLKTLHKKGVPYENMDCVLRIFKTQTSHTSLAFICAP